MIYNEKKEKLLKLLNYESKPMVDGSIYELSSFDPKSEKIINLLKKGIDYRQYFNDSLVGVFGKRTEGRIKNDLSVFEQNKIFVFHSDLENAKQLLKFFYEKERWVCVLGNSETYLKLKRDFNAVPHFVFLWDDKPKQTIIKKSDSFYFFGQNPPTDLFLKIRNNKTFEIEK